ncbi:MAG: hypothetical protein GWN55_08665 [Phycisphaerae bacterium]|nr:hypothetical protein [Phycisphaerae bacterium]
MAATDHSRHDFPTGNRGDYGSARQRNELDLGLALTGLSSPPGLGYKP